MERNEFLSLAMHSIFASAICSSAAIYSSAVNAADEIAATEGKIEVKGVLVNSACDLASTATPVQVDFGEIPVVKVNAGGEVGSVAKTIDLELCDTLVATTALVSYTPAQVSSDPTLAAVTGVATNVGVGLKDSEGNNVTWGAQTASVTLSDGNSQIPFTAYLKKIGTATAGDFTSTINFKIDYQ